MIDRMLALSIHNTVLNRQGRVNKLVKEALAEVQKKGIQVTFVTSSHFSQVKKIAKALHVNGNFITHHGAYISSADEKPIYVRRLDEDVTSDLIRLLEGFSCSVNISHEAFSVSNQLKDQKDLMVKAIFTPGDRSPYQHRFVEDLTRTIEQEKISPLHIDAVFENPGDLLDAQAAIRGMFSNIEVEIQGADRLTILPEGVSKLNALLYLTDYVGISVKEVVGIGMQLNNFEWLEACRLMVAMGDAPPEIRHKANWITRTAEENGVSYMVKEHFRKQQPIEFLRKMNIIDK